MKSNLQRKLFTTSHLLGLTLALALPASAAAPDGNYSFGWFNGTYVSIYDISGTYEIEELVPMENEPPLEISFDITLVQDGKGKVYGSGITTVEFEQDGDDLDEVPAFYEVKGKVKTAGDITAVFLKVRAFGSGPLLGFNQDYFVKTTLKSFVDPPNDRFLGLSKGKVKASALGTSKFVNLNSYDLPGGMDGSWRLFLDITPDDRNLLGSGTIELSSGDMLPFELKGKHKDSSDLSKTKLTGLDGALGSKMNRILTGNSGNTLLSYKGKVLGQKVQWEAPLP